MRAGLPKGKRPLILDDAINLPNALTLSRIVGIPFVLWFMDSGTPKHNFYAALIYVGCAVTDALDGWLARRQGITSIVGKFLDPLADKLLIMATLVFVIYDHRVGFWGTMAIIVILAREISITALRGIAAGEGLVLAAAQGGKDKTALQMVAILMLILYHPYPLNFFFATYPVDLARVGEFLMYLSLLLALTSAGSYVSTFVRAVNQRSEDAAVDS